MVMYDNEFKTMGNKPRIKLNHNSYNNIAKGRGKTKGSRIFQSVSRFLSKIG